jgi:hypothetical protein
MTPGDPSQLLKAWIECRDAECEGRGVNFGHFYVDDARAVLAELEALRVVAEKAEVLCKAIAFSHPTPQWDETMAALDHYQQVRSTETK